MRILLEDTMSITIDYQERLMPAIAEAEALLARSEILLKGLCALGVANIVTRQYPKGLGETVSTIKNVTEHSKVYDKLSFSCYDDEEIKKAVDVLGKKNVIICGVEAHVCVLQTVVDLEEAGYNCIIVEDCVSSRRLADKTTGLVRAAKEGAIITSSEAILFELTRYAGTDKFKEISRLVK